MILKAILDLFKGGKIGFFKHIILFKTIILKINKKVIFF